MVFKSTLGLIIEFFVIATTTDFAWVIKGIISNDWADGLTWKGSETPMHGPESTVDTLTWAVECYIKKKTSEACAFQFCSMVFNNSF